MGRQDPMETSSWVTEGEKLTNNTEIDHSRRNAAGFQALRHLITLYTKDVDAVLALLAVNMGYILVPSTPRHSIADLHC